jgi:hypothetical protein
VESRIVQLQEYLQRLIGESMIFNQQMTGEHERGARSEERSWTIPSADRNPSLVASLLTGSTRKIVDFLDHDGTLSIQVR